METHYVNVEELSTVVESIRNLQETVLRTDERVKLLINMQAKSEENLHELRNLMTGLVSRVAVLESRDENEIKIMVTQNRERIYDIEKQINALAIQDESHNNKWKNIFEWIGKILFILTASWILLKLGINPAAVN